MSTEHPSHFTSRFKRYSKVTKEFSSLGLRAAFAHSKKDSTSFDMAHALTETLGSLKGPLMKIGQVLSMVPGLLPDDYHESLQKLQNHAPPMGTLFVKRRMRMELGENWLHLFKRFDLSPFAAASLGQVHSAELHTEDHVVCKLQYPDMSSQIDADLKQLNFFLSLYQYPKNTIDHTEIFIEIQERFSEELDYQKEAQNIKVFSKIFQKDSHTIVPQVFEDYTTKKLLTMRYHEGQKIQTFLESSQDTKNTLGKLLFLAWYKPLYTYGILHGDPHFGNYLFTEDQKIILLDFGCIRYFDAPTLKGVIHLYYALKNNDSDLLYEAYKLWGFSNLNKNLLEALTLWAKFLYTPLLEDAVRPLYTEPVGALGKKIVSTIYKELKNLGGVKPPRSFVFLDRAAIGIGSALSSLNAHQNWHQLFESLIENFDSTAIIEHQKQLISSL